MGMILTGIVLAVAIAIGAGYFLPKDQKTAWQAFSTTSVRVGEPGNNLVGPGWEGDPKVEKTEQSSS